MKAVSIITPLAILASCARFSDGEYLRSTGDPDISENVIVLEGLRAGLYETAYETGNYEIVADSPKTTATDDSGKGFLKTGIIPEFKDLVETLDENKMANFVKDTGSTTVNVSNRTPDDALVWVRFSTDEGQNWETTEQPFAANSAKQVCQTNTSYMFLYAKTEDCEWKDQSEKCENKFKAGNQEKCFVKVDLGSHEYVTIALNPC